MFKKQGPMQSVDPDIASRHGQRIDFDVQRRIDPDPERSGAHGSDGCKLRDRGPGGQQHLDPEDR